MLLLDGKKLNELKDSAFRCSFMKGFHAESHGVNHYLMLVLTEVGEAVEADRRGKRADVHGFESSMLAVGDLYFEDMFCRYIKDTVEDELADVVIRLMDLVGLLGLSMKWYDDEDECEETRESFDKLFCGEDFSEQMFMLSCLITECGCAIEPLDVDEDREQMVDDLFSVYAYVFHLADAMGIDLLWHIEQKMKYNEKRPAKHGKRY